MFWICGRLREVVAHGSCTVQPWRFHCIILVSLLLLLTSVGFFFARFAFSFKNIANSERFLRNAVENFAHLNTISAAADSVLKLA